MDIKFQNRDLEWLKFNERILAMVNDSRFPLLERVKFLQIFQSNLDEFFMKRVGGLMEQIRSGVITPFPDGLTPAECRQKIRKRVIQFNKQIKEILETKLIGELKDQSIHLLKWNELNDQQIKQARSFFQTHVFPVLTPMAVDKGHPFPLISNFSMSLAVSLRHPKEGEKQFARVKIPRAFSTWLRFDKGGKKTTDCTFISMLDVVREHLPVLFPKMEVLDVMPFRVTRNIDIETADQDADDLLEMITEQIRKRKFEEVVRLETGAKPDPWLLQFLRDELELEDDDIYEWPLPLEFKDLSSVVELPHPQLKYEPWSPVVPSALADPEANIFDVIHEQDLLVYHPFDSFNASVERFIRTAVEDSSVVAIKMTLYRTNEKSPIVQDLIRAAEQGKHVVCLIELRARLDEERNIYWANRMEQAGVHVVYGIVGLKTHSKVALVVRQERSDFVTYCHIGTGNYNPSTANLYTDLGLLTADHEITNDVVELFHYLTGRSLKDHYEKLLVAPVNMKKRFLDLIEAEIENQKAGKPSGIIAKMNSIQDPEIIEALYRASGAGVSVDLIVRGFCCLLPGKRDLSQNIRVRSIVGRFLEHARIFYFRSGAADEISGQFFIGSADWMIRNLSYRVEAVTPIEAPALKKKLWSILQTQLKDNSMAWELDSKGNYVLRVPQDGEAELNSQQRFCQMAKSQDWST